MQEPAVIIILSFLFTFIALVLLDAFYVGSRFAGVGESLISGNGWSSNFFTGVLAVVVASPCTAPFMAAALGVALVSEPPVTLLLFNALALGFALPLTLLFISKRFARLMPQPGEWMNTFKRALAFPMLLTVAWLCWIYAGQTDLQAQFVLLIALILFCMSLWLSAQTSSKPIKAILAIVVLLCFSLPIYLTANMHSVQQKSAQITEHYMPYSADVLASLKAQNSVVLVNMTADWCITCKVNEQVAFSNAEVKKLLLSERVTYMVGDWTNKNDALLTYLHQYDRAGVPLYVIYAGEKSIQVLPQILTPNRVVTALNQAIKEISND
jgi:thiol:disulfide interchange protein DsbD